MKTLEIVNDENGSNPRDERNFDNFCTIFSWHRRYNLTDANAEETVLAELSEQQKESFLNKSEPSEIFDFLVNTKLFFVIPLYMYNHSGVDLKVSNNGNPFHCPWDSGQLGFVVVPKSLIRSTFSVKNVSKTVVKKVIKLINCEISTLTCYLNGEVYGFKILDENKEEVDACYGFYGSDYKTNGMLDYIPEELHSQLLTVFN